MGVNTRNMESCLQKYNKLNKSHLVGQLLNSIHDAWTHVYKIHYFAFVTSTVLFLFKLHTVEMNAWLGDVSVFQFVWSRVSFCKPPNSIR